MIIFIKQLLFKLRLCDRFWLLQRMSIEMKLEPLKFLLEFLLFGHQLVSSIVLIVVFHAKVNESFRYLMDNLFAFLFESSHVDSCRDGWQFLPWAVASYDHLNGLGGVCSWLLG
jgi:hypothetical protein